MKNKTLKTTLFLAAIFLVSFSVYAFAHGGRTYMGSSNHMGYGNHMGYNSHMGGYGMMYNDNMWEDLSAEGQTRMQESMNKFFSDTKEIREARYNKQLELNKEYSKTEIDKGKVKKLQNEIFDLSSKFEKKRYEHMETVQELFGNETNRYSAVRGYQGCFN